MKKSIIICAFIVLCLCSCGNNEDKTITYEDLSSEHQTIIDNIYDNYSSWKSIRDSDSDVMVTKINFLYEDDTLLFITYYDEGNDGIAYTCQIREVGENGELTGHSYDNTLFNDKERIKKNKAMMAGVNGFEYPLNEDDQKDVLANAFYKTQEDK